MASLPSSLLPAQRLERRPHSCFPASSSFHSLVQTTSPAPVDFPSQALSPGQTRPRPSALCSPDSSWGSQPAPSLSLLRPLFQLFPLPRSSPDSSTPQSKPDQPWGSVQVHPRRIHPGSPQPWLPPSLEPQCLLDALAPQYQEVPGDSDQMVQLSVCPVRRKEPERSARMGTTLAVLGDSFW